MQRFTAMVLVCGLMVATLQVSAQPGGRPPGGAKPATPEELVARVFAFDKNTDDKLTKEELNDPRLARLFARADADSDGFVTRNELTSLFVKESAAGGGSGPGAGPGGPRFGQIIPRFAEESLKLTDEQKTQLEALQKEVDARLEKILTTEQKQQLRELRDRGPGARPPR